MKESRRRIEVNLEELDRVWMERVRRR